MKPTKEDMIKLFDFMLQHDDIIPSKDIAHFMGLKFVDDLLPKMNIGPDWSYDEIAEFLKEHGIVPSDTIAEARKKLIQ